MEQAPAALQLRFLQVYTNFTPIRDQRLVFKTLSSISAEKNHTFVFPLPIDLVKGILGTGDGEDDEQHEDVGEEMTEKVKSYPE